MPHGDLKEMEAPLPERLVTLTGEVILGTSGAITSQDCNGFSVALDGDDTGRYNVTLANKFTKLRYGHAVLELSADTAAVQAKGVVGVLRNVSMTAGTLDIQFTTVPTGAAAGADAVPENSAVMRIVMILSRGTI